MYYSLYRGWIRPSSRVKLLRFPVVIVAPYASSRPNTSPLPSDITLPVNKGLKHVKEIH